MMSVMAANILRIRPATCPTQVGHVAGLGRTALLIFLPLLLFSQPRFNEQRAFDYLQTQVDFGPRYYNTAGYQQMTLWLHEGLRSMADTVHVQTFSAVNPYSGERGQYRNFIARLNPEKTPRLMIMAHYDTRPVADMDPDPQRQNEPILGANDGGSGVAVLLEILHALHEAGMKPALDIAFWDAEDMGRSGNNEEYCLGSSHYARNPVLPKPDRAILLDMVGDAELQFYMEGYSLTYAPGLTVALWKTAESLGYSDVFIPQRRGFVYDDHVPLNRIAKIPSIDIIDFDYPYEGDNFWHTHEDTADKCSPGSLGITGQVVLSYILEND